MPWCEKCWGDAYLLARDSGRSQAEHYAELLEQRKDNPCKPAEQRYGDSGRAESEE